MPNRIVREAILSSEAMAKLKWDEEVFYRRLMSIVDDYGRYEGNPQLLRSKCYPLQTDDVQIADIAQWLSACQKAGLLTRYAQNGKSYLEICKFGQQLRSASKCPDPEESDISCYQMISDAHLGVSVSVVVSDIPVANATGSGIDDSLPAVDGTLGKKPKRSAVPFEEIVNLYHEILPKHQRFEKFTDARRGLIRQRWLQDLPTLDAWKNYFADVATSKFMTGKVEPRPGNVPFMADLEWLCRPSNFAKVLEGKYHR